ncbi:MAG: hypothetical protein JO078_11570 [Candidatus Eremiobacteraeota bacterium]|nr:hypothetical protein [Candidatus Eremiobacteraeota bacterium]MBV9057345.1 hypothetical protein [Candidatus Eremiobacteraeota bacterium]MBV9700748.1 hypothetical protein [Candidatus Eremiobacteraeota bacterium]
MKSAVGGVALRSIVICAFALLPPVAAASGNTSSPVDDLDRAKVSSALQILQRFNSSHSLKDAEEAIRTMQSAYQGYTFTPENLIARRRTLVWAWAQIIFAVQRSYDPNWNPMDPANLPERCLYPPPEAAGQMPTCDDPDAVKDPKLRAQYIRDIQANELKKTKAEEWQRHQIVDEEAMAVFEGRIDFLHEMSPKGVPSDAAALDGIVREANLSDATRETLHRYFCAPSSQRSAAYEPAPSDRSAIIAAIENEEQRKITVSSMVQVGSYAMATRLGAGGQEADQYLLVNKTGWSITIDGNGCLSDVRYLQQSGVPGSTAAALVKAVGPCNC